jgi:hypothetical protein
MTDPIEIERLHGVVEAFLDGETVDPSTLNAALANEAARDHFIDLLVIRGALGRLDAADMRAARPAHDAANRVRWLAVAAGVLVSLSAGYLAGQRVVSRTPAPSTVEAVVIVDPAPPAPEPTQSIALKPGINWTDRSGGR